MRLVILLALDDAASEDDVFEIEDREIVIFQFFGGVEGYDIVQRANQVAYSSDRKSWHTGNSTGARLRCITFRLWRAVRGAKRRAKRVAHQPVVIPQPIHAAIFRSTDGCSSATLINVFAAALGSRRPCSQS